MVQRAANTPTSGAERHIRLAFERKLSKLRKLRLVNDIDSSTPSLEFTLISDYVTGEDVYRGDPEAWEGCSKPCHHHGCDSPRECKCLEYAAVNEDALRREDAKLFAEYMQAKQTGEGVGMRSKWFPILHGGPHR
jgi:histone-lysine N-methyltransferase SUV39H